MIKIINLDNKTQNPINFEITRFPDNTSQAWRLDKELSPHEEYCVLWMFENGKILRTQTLEDIRKTAYDVG